MFIKYIGMCNWKCFTKQEYTFDKQNIITWRNGKGKSSMFQAIIFCLYGKRPTGFNESDLKLDKNKDTVVRVDFSYNDSDGDNHEVKVRRQFGNKKIVQVKQDGELICIGHNQAVSFMEKIIPYDIVSVLWAPNTLQSSNILNPDFLVSSLFNYVFKDPKKIEKYYKYQMFLLGKELKTFKVNSEIYNKNEERFNEITKEISDIKENIKEKSKYTSNNVIKAKNAQIAAEKIQNEDLSYDDSISESICQEYISFVRGADVNDLREKITAKLKEEQAKTDSVLDKINKQIIKFISDESKSSGKCVICGSEWSQEITKKLDEYLSTDKIDHKKIENYIHQLKLLSYNADTIYKNMKYKKLKYIYDSCPNFEEIINSYNADNDALWNKLSSLEKEQEEIKIIRENYKKYIECKKKYDAESKKLAIVQEYISDASSYYSNTMTEEASQILCSLNPKYDQIFLDENQYKVTKVDEATSTIDLLNALQLSSGERTLIGASLIFSARDLFFPNAPLLFDESFSALDKEHISALKEYFKKKDFQVFIITHDNFWKE